MISYSYWSKCRISYYIINLDACYLKTRIKVVSREDVELAPVQVLPWPQNCRLLYTKLRVRCIKCMKRRSQSKILSES